MRALTLIIAAVCSLAPLVGATLEKLSLDEMIAKSTAIVRVRVTGSRTARHGSLIYTFNRMEVLESLKGAGRGTIEVAIPGGAYGNLRQEFSGAPALKADTEYVLFLWRGKSGITHVIGLSQGVFGLALNKDGEVVVHRAASGEVMLDPQTGQPMQDRALSMALSELRNRVDRALGTKRK